MWGCSSRRRKILTEHLNHLLPSFLVHPWLQKRYHCGLGMAALIRRAIFQGIAENTHGAAEYFGYNRWSTSTMLFA
jgi:hypothetical protein